MARRDDDDDDDRAASSGSRTVVIIFAVIGGMIALGVLGCVGCIGFGVFQARTAFKGIIETTTTATQFAQNLQGNRFDQAYALMSNGYKAKVTKEQFEEDVKKHPLLVQHKLANFKQTNLPDGKSKNQSASFVMILSDTSVGIDTEMDEDDEDLRPGAVEKPKPPAIKKATPPPAKSIDLSLSLIEENGKWVIDSWSVIR